MNKFLHIGLSTMPNTHSKEMRQVFDTGDWQAEDIAVQHPDLNNEIIRVANAYRPDLTWIQIQSDGISKEAIEALKANGSFVIQWSGDKRTTLPECYFRYAQWGVDLSTFSNMEDIEIMRKCGYKADWLQIGASTEIYNTTGPVNSLAPIVFFGNSFQHFPLSGLRRDMVRELKRVYGDNFKAFGSGMPDGGQFMSDQNGEAAVYRGAKIGINLSHFDSPRYTSDRLMRMLLSGVCVLSHNYQNVKDDFDFETIGKHPMVLWNDIEMLKQKINLLLSDDLTRKSFAQNGYELALQKLTFKAMAENILNLYNQYKTS